MDRVKAKVGLLLIGTERFRRLGTDTRDGTYEQRKLMEAEEYRKSMNSFCDTVYTGQIYSRADLDYAMHAFFNEKVDCVFALFLSWSEDFLWIRFLRDMSPIPILFACKTRTGISFQNTFEENDFVEFLSAGGLVGSLEASGSIQRIQRPMLRTVIGTLPELMEKSKSFFFAAAVRSRLRTSNLGLLASYNEVMWSTYIDPYQIFTKIGPELRFLSVASLIKEITAVEETEVNDNCSLLMERYELLDDVEMDKFRESVRASLGLEKLARGAGVDLLVLNDVDSVLLTEVGLRPGFLPTPAGGDVIVVPEGDLGGGLAVYILKLLSGSCVSFVEPFHIDLDQNCFVAGHAGPNDYTGEGSVKIGRDVRFAKSNYKYAGAPFAWYVIPPGVKTMLHISECNGRYKMVCTLVEALPTNHFITSYSHGKFRPLKGTLQELFDQLIKIGVTQHYGIVEGDYTAELENLAGLLGFDFYGI